MAVLLGAVTSYADDLGTYCWQLSKDDGSSCILKLNISNAGYSFYAIQGVEFCSDESDVDSHVFGNGYLKGDKLELGLSSVGLNSSKTSLWHSGGVFEINFYDLKGVLYWVGDTEEKCGDKEPPCIVEQEFEAVACPLNL